MLQKVVFLIIFSLIIIALIGRLTTANYDETLTEILNQNVTSLSYNITAVPQIDSSRNGIAYLVDGLTNNVSNNYYWFQAALSYNWSGSGGFQFLNETWICTASSGCSVLTGAPLLTSFSGPVHINDIVRIKEYFSGGNLIMNGTDLNTGASAQVISSAFGSTKFISGYGTANIETTNLMTEQYNNTARYGTEQPVYSL